MEGFSNLNPESKVGITGINVPDKEKFLAQLTQMLKENKGSELIGTFQAGCIPVMLDTLARDTSEAGQTIVTKLYKMIDDLKTYYASRENKEEAEAEVKIPVKLANDEKPEE